jgi:soluble lytic murein transglycosylase-like protein/Zn-dependent protease with chaperone function
LTWLPDIAASAGEAALRATLLLAAVFAALALLRRASASLRHRLLTSALAGALLLPLFDLLQSTRIAVALPANAAIAPLLEAPQNGLAMLWLTGVLVGLARMAGGIVAIRRWRRDSALVTDPEMLDLLTDVCRTTGRRRRPELRIGGNGVPLTWGIRRSVILVPAAFASWSDALRRAVLLHEAAHITRRDSFTLFGASLASAVYWFHPLVWIAVRRLRFESERACDDATIRGGIAGETFAADLVTIAAARRDALRGLSLSSAAAAGMLESRIEALVTPRDRTIAGRAATVTCVAVASLATIIVAALHVVTPWAVYADAYGISMPLARMIMAAAREERVDVDLAFALVGTESGFRPNAVSRGGAIGLTQVMPGTARHIDREITAPQLLEPRTNLRIGFRVLQAQLHRYGNVETALTAYAIGHRELERRRAAGLPLPAGYTSQVLAARRNH